MGPFYANLLPSRACVGRFLRGGLGLRSAWVAESCMSRTLLLLSLRSLEKQLVDGPGDHASAQPRERLRQWGILTG